MTTENNIWERLRAPFDHDDVGWVPIVGLPKNAKVKEKVKLAAFVDARAIQDRLDDVVGPGNWQTNYRSGPDGGVLCELSIKVDGEWVTKCDAGENTAVEGVKGGISQALKRAAVHWGIGRYLYDVEAKWVRCDKNGKWVPPYMPSVAGEDPPNVREEKKSDDPLKQMQYRLEGLGFSKRQVDGFFSYIAEKQERSSIDEVHPGALRMWAGRMAGASDEKVRTNTMNALNESEEAA